MNDKEELMRYLKILGFVAIVGLLAGCASPEEKAANANAAVSEEKMRLSKQYQDCTQKSKTYKEAVAAGTGDQIKEADRMDESDCESIRKNLEALN